MSAEAVPRKKRNTTEITPAPEGDHRKRRRNRTTQSCLNCHTSKRMCDRRRPACARCTQLGLTGLCVYEVDDPTQRIDTQDESSRLTKRVAELEGVIRELKNKPHPRWVQASSSDEIEKWHSRSQIQAMSEGQSPSTAPSPPSSSASSEKGDTPSSSSSSRSPSMPLSSNEHSHANHIPRGNLRRSSPISPQSPLSPALMTPTDEYPPNVDISNLSQDFDMASMFLSYPGLLGCEEPSYSALLKDSQHTESLFNMHYDSHCGCLHESSCYNVVLELSLRLRKAADILAHSSSHHIGTPCTLNQRVSQLDMLATNALSNMPSPDYLASNFSQQNARMRPMRLHPAYRQLPSHTIPTQSLQNLCSWDVSNISSPPASTDDSFMSWDPLPRRS